MMHDLLQTEIEIQVRFIPLEMILFHALCSNSFGNFICNETLD